MALVLKDRVLETSTSTGTGAFTLEGAQTGFQSFSVVGSGNTTYYTIQGKNPDGTLTGEWEVGTGTYTTGSLARDTVLESSNANALVNFSAGNKDVFCDLPAEKVLVPSGTSSQLLANDGSGGLSNVTIGSNLTYSAGTLSATGGGGITYPGAGIANSTGSAWGTSYGTTGANSVVLRDANQNISANSISEGYSNVAAAGTTTTLTAASAPNYVVTGSGGQTFQLPDATTLPNGTNYQFNNNQSSGTIVVKNNSGTTVATVQSGGFVDVSLLSNSIAAGSWDVHNIAPSNVSWSTNTFDYAGSITSATWNGTTVQVNRGGTGTTTSTGTGSVVLSNSPVFPTDITVNSATVGKGAASRDNLAVGNGALSNASTTGTSNIGLGKGTLTSLTSGGSNIAIGYYALPANQSGANNIAIGYSALSSNIVGSNNVAIGNVLLSSTTDNNVGVGYGLGGGTTSQTVGVGSNIANSCNATDSIFFGYAAASALTTSNNSVVIGSQALGAATGTVGAGSIAIGYQASYTNNTAIQTAIGYQACWSATARGNGCTAIGYQALYTNGVGTASTTLSAANTTVGYKSLYANTTGRFNTALGHQAGWGAAGTNANTTGFNNIYIGYQTIGSASTNSNETVIGASAVGLGSGTVVLGNTSVSLTQLRGVIYGTNYTVATLPTATVGARAFVTDALTPVFGTAVTDGGAVAVPVYADNAGVWMVG